MENTVLHVTFNECREIIIFPIGEQEQHSTIRMANIVSYSRLLKWCLLCFTIILVILGFLTFGCTCYLSKHLDEIKNIYHKSITDMNMILCGLQITAQLCVVIFYMIPSIISKHRNEQKQRIEFVFYENEFHAGCSEF